MVLLAEIALIRITTEDKIPLVELLVKVTEQEELIRKLQYLLQKGGDMND